MSTTGKIEVVDQSVLQSDLVTAQGNIDRSEVAELILARLGERRINNDPRDDPRLGVDREIYDELDTVIFYACQLIDRRRKRLS
jgi:hypothetical protein